jgi:hypothetical protein
MTAGAPRAQASRGVRTAFPTQNGAGVNVSIWGFPWFIARNEPYLVRT